MLRKAAAFFLTGMKTTAFAALAGLGAGALAASAWRSDGGNFSRADSSRVPLPVENPASAASEPYSLAALRALIDPADPSGSAARVFRAVEALPPEAVPRLAKEVLALPKGDQDLFRLAFPLEERWMELFPGDAVAFAAQSQGRTLKALERVAERDPAEAERLFLTVPLDLRAQAWGSLLSGLTDRDPEAALARAAGRRPDGEESAEDQGWRSAVYHRWAGKDPAAAAAHLRRHGTPEEVKRTALMLNAYWMEKDPSAALAFVRGLPGYEHQERSILERLAERDPAKALAEMKKALVMSDRGDPVISAAWRADPAAVLAELEKRPQGKLRDDFQTAVMTAMAGTSVKEARDYVEKLTDPKAKQRGVGIIAGRMAGEDPAAAAKWYLEHTDGSGSQGISGPAHLMRVYAGEAPGEALVWAQLLGRNERSTALGTILPEWLREDAGAAAKAVLALPAGAGRQEALEALSRGWVNQAPEEAVAWAEGLTGPERGEALLALAEGCYQEKAQPAGRRAVAELLRDAAAERDENTTRRMAEAVSTVSGAWRSSPGDAAKAEEALKWIESLPSERVRATAVENWITHRVQADVRTASQWVQAQPRGTLRDHGARQLAYKLQTDDPAAAFAWAADIGEENPRRETLRMTVLTWQKTGAEAPRQAIESSAIPEAEKTQLLEMLNP